MDKSLTTESAVDFSLAIETEKLNLWYGDFQALFDVDLEIKRGIITSLIGPSGCGKTTLLRAVNRTSHCINSRLCLLSVAAVRELGNNLLVHLKRGFLVGI